MVPLWYIETFVWIRIRQGKLGKFHCSCSWRLFVGDSWYFCQLRGTVKYRNQEECIKKKIKKHKFSLKRLRKCLNGGLRRNFSFFYIFYSAKNDFHESSPLINLQKRKLNWLWWSVIKIGRSTFKELWIIFGLFSGRFLWAKVRSRLPRSYLEGLIHRT